MVLLIAHQTLMLLYSENNKTHNVLYV